MAQFSNRKRASDEKEVLKLKSGLNNHYLPKWRWLVVFLAELPRAKRARSGAPWVRKFGKPSIPENLVMT